MNPLPTEQNDRSLFDVREISCSEKHALIFARWAELAVGAHFVLINHHDPVPLYRQFAATFPEAFTWEYLERSPEKVQIKITRLTASPANAVVAPFSGGCGGHH